MRNFTIEELKAAANQGGADGYAERMDANESFHTSRALESLEAEVYRRVYPDLKWREFVMEDNSDGRGAETVSFDMIDTIGEAKFIDPDSGDAPIADVFKTNTPKRVHEIRSAWRWNITDLEKDSLARQNSMAGARIDVERPAAVRQVCERLLDKAMALGDASLGIDGFYSISGISATSLTTGSWAGATFDQVLGDLRQMDTKLANDNFDTDFLSDGLTLVLDDQSYTLLKAKKSAATDKSVLDVFMEDSATYIKQVKRWYRGRLADAAGTGPRFVVYRPDPRIISGVVPVPFEFMDRHYQGGGRWNQEGRIRTAGVRCRYKNGVAYFDGA